MMIMIMMMTMMMLYYILEGEHIQPYYIDYM